MKLRKKVLGILALAMCLLFTGCFIKSADELYALPKQSEVYSDLQNALNEILVAQAQYSSPISGSNQQPVQMSNLDGDEEDEAVIFINSGSTKPLKVYILDWVADHYENICVIEGDGSAFNRVEYAQLDGVPGLEIIIGRQVSNQVLQSIGAYSIVDGQLVELMSANYSEFTIVDLDQNGNQDLFLLRNDAETLTGYASLYHCVDGIMEREPEISVSARVGEIRHVTTGMLAPGKPAVFVGGLSEDSSVVTDIFTFGDHTFTGTSSLNDLHLVSVPVRGYNVYATDIDGDGFMELPDVVQLPGANPENGDSAYYVIRWYNYDPSSGLILKENTYHNYSSGWYLRLPDRMKTNFLVQRGEEILGIKGLGFYTNNGQDEAGDAMFTLYAFTGSNRNVIAGQNGCFVIGARGETTYAAKLGPGAVRIGLTQEELTSMFNFIQTDWTSGET